MGTPKVRRRTIPRTATTTARDIASYIAVLPPDRQRALRHVCEVVRRVMPHAHETMQYRMPTFEVAGSAKVAIASQKSHLALYVLDEEAVRRYRSRLGKVVVGKGCIRFRRADDLALAGFEAMLHDIVRHG